MLAQRKTNCNNIRFLFACLKAENNRQPDEIRNSGYPAIIKPFAIAKEPIIPQRTPTNSIILNIFIHPNLGRFKRSASLHSALAVGNPTIHSVIIHNHKTFVKHIFSFVSFSALRPCIELYAFQEKTQQVFHLFCRLNSWQHQIILCAALDSATMLWYNRRAQATT